MFNFWDMMLQNTKIELKLAQIQIKVNMQRCVKKEDMERFEKVVEQQQRLIDDIRPYENLAPQVGQVIAKYEVTKQGIKEFHEKFHLNEKNIYVDEKGRMR